jgi:CDP-diglyceride synthetase
MLIHTAHAVRSILSSLLVAVACSLFFWRIIKSNRGNRVIECGSIALMLGILMMLLMKLTNLPKSVLTSLGLLVLVLCLMTMFFLLVQGVHAIRHRNSKATRSGSGTNSVIRELGYEPRNYKEKWLLQTVYWGTILLVAVLLWEYIKAR